MTYLCSKRKLCPKENLFPDTTLLKKMPPLFYPAYAWVEENHVSNISYSDVINEILMRLPCVC